MIPEGGSERPRARRRSTAARPTDDELLDAARSVFVERGFEGATMGLVAERADSTKPTLYAHFGDKLAMYKALIARESEALSNWMLGAYRAASDLPVPDRLRAHVMALFDFAATNPEGFRLVFDWNLVEGPSGIAVRQRVLQAVFAQVAVEVRRGLVEMGRTRGRSAEVVASMLVGLTNGVARYAALAGDIDLGAAGELVAEFITAGATHFDMSTLDRIDEA